MIRQGEPVRSLLVNTCTCGDVDCYFCGTFGHVATVVRLKPGSAHKVTGLGGREEIVEVRRSGRGSKAAVTRAAKLTSGFLRVASVEAFSRQRWLRCYGEGRT